MSLDTRNLKYFVRVAEIGSISRAAKVLHIAQPALSTSLSNLEEYLDVRLFLRNARGVELTNEGRRLLAHAQLILGQIATAEQELRQFANDFTGPPTTVALIHSVARVVVPILYTRLKASHPKLRLRIINGPADEIAEGLLSGDVDCAVLPMGFNQDRINAVELFDEGLYLFAGKDVAAIQGEVIPFADAVQFPLLCAATSSWVGKAINDEAVARGLNINVGLETDLGQISHSLVAAGDLFLIATWSAVRNHEHGLKGVRIIEPEIRRTLCVATPRQRSLPPALQTVHAELLAIMQELRAENVFR